MGVAWHQGTGCPVGNDRLVMVRLDANLLPSYHKSGDLPTVLCCCLCWDHKTLKGSNSMKPVFSNQYSRHKAKQRPKWDLPPVGDLERLEKLPGVVVKSPGSGIHTSGRPLVLDPPLASLLLVSFWSLSFLICKVGVLVVLNLEVRINDNRYARHLAQCLCLVTGGCDWYHGDY